MTDDAASPYRDTVAYQRGQARARSERRAGIVGIEAELARVDPNSWKGAVATAQAEYLLERYRAAELADPG